MIATSPANAGFLCFRRYLTGIRIVLLFSVWLVLTSCGSGDSNTANQTNAINPSTTTNTSTTTTTDDSEEQSDNSNSDAETTLSVGSDPRLTAASEPVGKREDGSGAFRTHCLESHTNSDDPLVYPNQPGASHQHVFFGNPTVNAETTVSSLLLATETTCDGGTLNRSGYWVPALYDQFDERIQFVEPLFYYKTGYHVPAESIQTLPEGLRMLAGHAHASEAQSDSVIKYRCGSWTSDRVWFDQGDPLDHVAYLPFCDTDDILEIRIVFPQCWDGVNLYQDDQSHMAYPSKATPPITGTGSCPSTHPIALPEISYNFAIYVSDDTGPPSSWRFSCETSAGGLCAHADWMNGWEPIIMEKIVKNCLRPGMECMVSLLGDGTQLRSVITD